jgi:hypothetical protein
MIIRHSLCAAGISDGREDTAFVSDRATPTQSNEITSFSCVPKMAERSHRHRMHDPYHYFSLRGNRKRASDLKVLARAARISQLQIVSTIPWMGIITTYHSKTKIFQTTQIIYNFQINIIQKSKHWKTYIIKIFVYATKSVRFWKCIIKFLTYIGNKNTFKNNRDRYRCWL